MATLTLSAVEQVAVLNHLRIQLSRLPSGSEDALNIKIIVSRIEHRRVIALNPYESVIMLRYLRKQATALLMDMIALEERRIRGGFNGQLENAHRALDADRVTIEDVIRRLWAIIL